MEHKRRQIRTRQANQPRPNIVVYHREPRITARAQKSAVSCHLIACADRCDRQNRDKLFGQLRRSRRKGIINMQNRELRQKTGRYRSKCQSPQTESARCAAAAESPVSAVSRFLPASCRSKLPRHSPRHSQQPR